MRTSLKFAENIPEELHALLTTLFEPFLGVLSGEVRVLRISLVKGEQGFDGDAATLSLRRYHWAEILLAGSFFSLEREEQERTAAHEVVHVLHNVFSREIQHLVEHLVPEDIKEYISWRLEDAEERVVDTLGDALYDIVKARGGDE